MPTLRKLNVNAKALPLKTPQTQREAQEKYFVRLIQMHPKYQLVVRSLKEGIKPTEIAAFFAKNSWLKVNERTFAEAIRTFKHNHQAVIDASEGEGLDRHVDPNRPSVDLRAQLHQLLRLQRVRLGRELDLEFTLPKAFNTTVKEIEEMRLIVETLAKMDGTIKEGGRHAVQEESDVKENLNNIKKDQLTKDRLHQQVKQLVEVKAS